jgi:hypothetical protein
MPTPAGDPRNGLSFLDFDFSEDADGQGTFDAMASAEPGRLAALEAEIVQVLQWAHLEFGAPAPLEDGGAWDYALQGVQEIATALDLSVDTAAGRLQWQPRDPAPPRITFTLTLTGTPAFCEAFRAAFGVA